MIEAIINYRNYLNQLPSLLSKSKFKMEYFIEKLQVSPATFYRKMKEKKFTINEVEVLSRELHPEEYYKFKFMQELKESIQEMESGKVKSNKDVLKGMHEKIEKLVS